MLRHVLNTLLLKVFTCLVFFCFFFLMLSLVKSCHPLWTQVHYSQISVNKNLLSPNMKEIYFFCAHSMLIRNLSSPDLRERIEQSAVDLISYSWLVFSCDVVLSLIKWVDSQKQRGTAALLVLTILTLGSKVQISKVICEKSLSYFMGDRAVK